MSPLGSMHYPLLFSRSSLLIPSLLHSLLAACQCHVSTRTADASHAIWEAINKFRKSGHQEDESLCHFLMQMESLLGVLREVLNLLHRKPRSPESIAQKGRSNRVSPRSTPRSPESIATNGRSKPTSPFEVIILLIGRDGVEESLLRSCPARETVRPYTR